MYIDDVLWMSGIIDKLLAKHGVTQEEVEQVIWNRPRMRWQERGHVLGEDLYAAYGRTDEGRFLVVFFVLKPANGALIVSARDMDAGERRRHERK